MVAKTLVLLHQGFVKLDHMLVAITVIFIDYRLIWVLFRLSIYEMGFICQAAIAVHLMNSCSLEFA